VSQQDLLRRIITALGEAGVPYMLTGSLVSSLQGEPRATHDIDLVVSLGASGVAAAVAALSAPDLYLDPDAVAEAVARRNMFNLIDPASGDKADFWILTDDEYDTARFARRRTVEVLGAVLVVTAPEDTILMKLRWAAEGGSEKQRLDALRVYEVQQGALDQKYLEEWAERLGVDGLLAGLQADAEPVDD
jgi:hypothetical protein